MKKILSLLIAMILVSTPILAGPPMPQPFVVFITFEGTVVPGIDVTFTCASETIVETTNDKGGVMLEISNVVDCPILDVSCGYDACDNQYSTVALDYPYYAYYELGVAPPIPEPECTGDSDCNSGYECISEECSLIPIEEPIVEDKVTSNADGTIALVESNYGDCIDVIITDSKLSKLFDGQIDFDTEDYDTHEEIKLKGCFKTSIDNVDYTSPQFVIQEGEIEYLYIFDDALPLSTIEQDEELEINFLGEDIEIISLSSSRMTIRHGEIFDYETGCVELEEITYEGLPIKIISINEDSVYLSYNGESKQIFRDNIDEVGGIQVYVDESIPREDKANICSIRVAEDIEEVIDDGDEYIPGWEYSISDGSIGIRNSEDYKYLDEEYVPLDLGDKITLPNDFAIIKFNKISTSDTTELRIKVREEYLNVLGSREDDQDDAFTYNNQDYDELYVGAEGILDKDKELITTDKVRIGESEIYLEKGSIIIGDLVIELGFTDITYKGESYLDDSESFLDYLGIIFKDPEGSIKSESTFDVTIPDELPEVTITVGAESETEGLPDVPVVCDKQVACTEEECVATVCPPVVDCPTCPIIDCPEVPEDEGDLAARLITGVLSALGGAGIFFKLFNNKIFTSSNTGMKTYRGRDGTLKIHHKHPGTRGYHNPDTSHRAPETHPKGAVDVANHYQKNSKGDWEYR